MRGDEVIASANLAADAADAVVSAVRDVHGVVADRAFGSVSRVLGSWSAVPRIIHDAVAAVTYATVGGVLSGSLAAVGAVAGRARPEDASSLTESRHGAMATAAVNGLWGDRLEAARNALHTEMGVRVDGIEVPLTPDGLAAAFPRAGPRVVVFVHGLCESETSWWSRHAPGSRHEPPTHGHRLRDELGWTPVFVRYNSGRRVSTSGADLHELLSSVHEHWPVAIEEIAVVGHSMGGLVARSAASIGVSARARWVEHLRHVVCLGTPHHGAPLEKTVNAGAWALARFASSRPLAGVLNRRSVGVKDLRFGNVHEEDWHGHDPDALLTDTRTRVGTVAHVRHHVVAGVLAPGWVGVVAGDGLVRTASATGAHHRRPLTFDTVVALDEPVHHLAMLHHPRVYAHIRRALVAADGEHAG